MYPNYKQYTQEDITAMSPSGLIRALFAEEHGLQTELDNLEPSEKDMAPFIKKRYESNFTLLQEAIDRMFSEPREHVRFVS